jgi:hypothetical protein
MAVKTKAPVKKAAPAKAPIKKAVAAKKAAAKLAKGDKLECYVCGLSIVVDEITGYAEERVLICCDEPMKAKRKAAPKAAAKPAAKKAAAKPAAKKKK